MKIATLVSGLLVVIFLILFFTGTIEFENAVQKSITEGNGYYADNNYDKALDAYKIGLNINPEDQRLNYNSGQASYLLNNYEEAVAYYSKASDIPDKYLNSGNSCLKLAESAGDNAQKQQYLRQALETYKQGIIAFPENLPLKYNYEYVKNMLDDENNNNEQNEENQDNQDQNNQEENFEQNDQKDNSQQNEENSDSQQNDSSSQENKEEQNQGESEEQQNSQADENKEQQEGQTGEEKDGNNADENEQAAQQTEPSEADQTDSQIANILRMLEKQEQESLKNNQEQKGSTKGDEYDW